MTLKHIFREPLVHFLILGAALFAAFQLRGGAGPESSRIVITQGRIENLSAGFGRAWQRPPTEVELKGLIDDFVREEMAVREAAAMGLDRDDTIIRRRLRQKLEFLAEETTQMPPTDSDLQVWLRNHPESFRTEAEATFKQVFVNPDRRGERVGEDARRLLERLRRAGADAAIDALGDPIMLPQDVPLAPRSEILRLFGSAFADTLLTLKPGTWTGPIRSGYGYHLVLVRDRRESRLPELAEVRPLVEREFLADQRRRGLEALYDRLLERYTVVVESPAAGAGAADSSARASSERS